jgi:outer membrane beta-barrel protein
MVKSMVKSMKSLGPHVTVLSIVLSYTVAAHAQPDDDSEKQATPVAVANDANTKSPVGVCVDQVIADRLAQKRKRRGAIDRLFIKQARHEITASGGYYNSDLFSGTYVVGGSYTHANADVIRALEDKRGQLLANTYERVVFAEAALVWSPVYGKLRFGGAVRHFDIDLSLGVGVVDSEASRGASGVVGVGWKLFAGQAWSFRLDFRNRTFYQDLLDQRQLVNDSTVTAGVSLFLPFTP